jgi:hypothetical protein
MEDTAYTEIRVEHLKDQVAIIAELENGKEIIISLNKEDANFVSKELRLFVVEQEGDN